ncbi:MAG TPA: PHP domain-containing protein [Gaiellaceae bacterium]|nr:PHP domain-containing protein [Gaiellaceae bacterium]
MTRNGAPLLCELHAHTTWSDGALSVREVVDLYGDAGFDVLAITDHVVASACGIHVRAETFDAYLDEVEAEAERALAVHGLLVLPGLELTFEHEDAAQAGHAVAIGLHRFVGVDAGLDAALREARSAGAALIAAHPYPAALADGAIRTTARFAEEPQWAAGAVDRFELVNRHDVFGWVAERRFPAVATGDFHVPEHLATWKTLLSCPRTPWAVVDELCSDRPAALTRVDPVRGAPRRAA